MLLPFSTDSVNLVDEHDTWCVLLSDSEELSYELRPVTKVFLDELGADDAEEGG